MPLHSHELCRLPAPLTPVGEAMAGDDPEPLPEAVPEAFAILEPFEGLAGEALPLLLPVALATLLLAPNEDDEEEPLPAVLAEGVEAEAVASATGLALLLADADADADAEAAVTLDELLDAELVAGATLALELATTLLVVTARLTLVALVVTNGAALAVLLAAVVGAPSAQ